MENRENQLRFKSDYVNINKSTPRTDHIKILLNRDITSLGRILTGCLKSSLHPHNRINLIRIKIRFKTD